MGGLDRHGLVGRWVHAHEEDSDSEMIFRPATHPLPPARGRTSLELRPDGTYVQLAPGPVDVPEESAGRWSLEGTQLVLSAEGRRADQALEVVAAESDRLTIRK
jgi:hypothetical protein